MEKAVEALLYVTARVPNMYKALKVLYFADRLHLWRHGRLVYGDTYVAMRHGPVPSAGYDILKASTPAFPCDALAEARRQFRHHGHRRVPVRPADVSLLSESETECLDEAIRRYGAWSVTRLRAASHDPAYDGVDENDAISPEDIARSLPDGEELLGYLRGG